MATTTPRNTAYLPTTFRPGATPPSLAMIQADADETVAVEIIPDPFDADHVDALHRDYAAKDTRLLVYTEGQVGTRFDMGMFGDFAPSVVYAINRHHGHGLPYRETNLHEFALSKLCHLYCTLLKSMMFGYGTSDAALSKLRSLRSVCAILRRPELIMEKSEVSDGEVADVFAEVLLAAASMLDEVVVPPETQFEGRSAKKHPYAYVDELKRLLGENLVAVMLYGSSASGAGADFDNIVVVDHFDRHVLTTLTGQTIYEGEKEVGIILVESRNITKFLYINVSNFLFRHHSRVLYGKIALPVENESYSIRKELYHAGFGSSKLVAALSLVYREPEVLVDKAGLFDYFMKLNRFSFHGLYQIDGYVPLPRETIYETLATRYHFRVPEFKPDVEHIRSSMMAANACSALLSQRMYSPRKMKGRNETLLKVLAIHRAGFYAASLDNRKVFVFPAKDKLAPGQVVPVRLLDAGSEAHDRRRKWLTERRVKLPDDFEIGERV